MSARSMICRLAVCLALLPAAAAAQLDKIPWAKGPTKGVLGAEATITVPASCLFTGMDGVKAFLEATQNLTWVIPAHDNEGGRTVNHSVRLLGRGGVMHADLVTTPEQLAALVPTFNTMIGGYTYSAGYKYAEWRSGDKVAAYGLTALVAGGAGVALVKSGLLVKFWKLIVIGFAALVGALKRLWSRITGKRSEMQPRGRLFF